MQLADGVSRSCYPHSVSMSPEQASILAAIRALPRVERLRLVEQVVHELAEEGPVDGRSIIGLFSDEPELIDEVCRGAMEARERDPLRVSGE